MSEGMKADRKETRAIRDRWENYEHASSENWTEFGIKEWNAYPFLKLLNAALVNLFELLRQGEELAIEGADQVIEGENRLLHGL